MDTKNNNVGQYYKILNIKVLSNNLRNNLCFNRAFVELWLHWTIGSELVKLGTHSNILLMLS